MIYSTLYQQNMYFEDYYLQYTGGMEFIISQLKTARNSESLCCDGFTSEELVECLGRMAVNDSNKKKVSQ